MIKVSGCGVNDEQLAMQSGVAEKGCLTIAIVFDSIGIETKSTTALQFDLRMYYNLFITHAYRNQNILSLNSICTRALE